MPRSKTVRRKFFIDAGKNCTYNKSRKLPILGIIFSLLGSIVGLYALVGIVLSILVFLKVVK